MRNKRNSALTFTALPIWVGQLCRGGSHLTALRGGGRAPGLEGASGGRSRKEPRNVAHGATESTSGGVRRRGRHLGSSEQGADGDAGSPLLLRSLAVGAAGLEDTEL